jgi:amino acid transporter
VERVTQYVLRSGRPASLIGLQVGAGALAMLAATIVGAMLPASSGEWHLAPVAAAVLGFGAVGADLRAVMSTAALGYLLAMGFLVNRFGELSWHGAPDVGRLALIGGAAGAGVAAGAVRRHNHRDHPLAVTVYENERAGQSGRRIDTLKRV